MGRFLAFLADALAAARAAVELADALRGRRPTGGVGRAAGAPDGRAPVQARVADVVKSAGAPVGEPTPEGDQQPLT